MKPFLNFFFFSTTLLIASATAKAQPGWVFLPGDHTEPEPLQTLGVQTTSELFVQEGDEITPEIADLARDLQYDPVMIFNYVRNEIHYVPYYGLTKGAALCLIEGSGNDFDQSALLAALLEESGYSPVYRYGTMTIPLSSPDGMDMLSWLPVTNSTGVRNMLEWTGNPGFVPTGSTFNPHRVWIEVDVEGETRYLDPAYKHYDTISGLSDILTEADYNPTSVLNAAGGTSTLSGVDPQYYAEGMNLTNLHTELETRTTSLLEAKKNLYPNVTTRELIGGRVAVKESVTTLPTSPNFPVSAMESWSHGEIPDTYATKITFFIQNRLNKTIYSAELQGKRLSLTLTDATNFRAALWLDDEKIAEESSAPGSSTTLRVSFTHPSPTFTAGNRNDGGKPYKRGANYALIYGFDAEGGLMRHRQRQLDAYRAAGLTNDSREVMTETLNVVGLQWLYQTGLFQRMSTSIDPNILFFTYHRFGRMSQEEGFFIDVPLQTLVSMNRTGTFIPGNPAIFGSSYFASAMEHGVLQQTQGSDKGAVSTIKMIETAIRTGGRVFFADGANYETGDHIRSKLTGYQTGTLNNFSNVFNNPSNFAILPQQGDYSIDDWTGTAYMQAQGNSIGMIINGSYGGYSTNYGTISTPAVTHR
ncbi:MAG: hypothetical protein PF795_11530, partial [Kiritimatiellae bacterium]|nr:hypothetical protein [Kiritimatiellia bacterium]